MTPKQRLRFLFQTPKGRQSIIFLLGIFVTSLALDQLSKIHAHSVLLIKERSAHVHDFHQIPFAIGTLGERTIEENGIVETFLGLQFRYARNRGAAFSFLDDLDDTYRTPFFFVVTLVAIGMMLFYLYDTPLTFPMTRFGMVMILSGAVGNFIDRLRLGYVIDFIDVDWHLLGWYHDFAIFNVADMAINIGVGFFIVEYIIKKPYRRKKSAVVENSH